MTSGFDDYWDRKIRGNDIPDEFGGPVKGVTGRDYEQLEFDFANSTPDFIELSDAAYEAKAEKSKSDLWTLRNNVSNHIMQARAILDVVMNDIGTGGRDHDNHEYALWGASELLQNALDLLE